MEIRPKKAKSPAMVIDWGLVLSGQVKHVPAECYFLAPPAGQVPVLLAIFWTWMVWSPEEALLVLPIAELVLVEDPAGDPAVEPVADGVLALALVEPVLLGELVALEEEPAPPIVPITATDSPTWLVSWAGSARAGSTSL